jgi:hypothetical protein
MARIQSNTPSRRSMRGNKPSSTSSVFSNKCVGILLVFAAILSCARYLSRLPSLTTSPSSESQDKQSLRLGTSQTNKNNIELLQSSVGSIPYYHCPGTKNDLVLLHGSKFTKEDWRTSGILGSFCGQDDLSVTALDLSVRATHTELQAILTDLEDKGRLRLPVSAIVTPSASGFTMVDWLGAANPDSSALLNFTKGWVPVASGSVMTAPDQLLTTWRSSMSRLMVLAVHGDQDKGGKISSSRLKQIMDAKVVELPGRHPCYLDSPDAFVSTVLEHIIRLV